MNTFIHLNKLQGLATKSKSSILGTAFVACATLCFIAAIGTANTAKAASAAVAAQDGSLGAKQQRRVPSLRSNVYDQLARAQKTADDKALISDALCLIQVSRTDLKIANSPSAAES